MEEYLKNMWSLRSQMNDIEEEAAKRSVQEQMQMTAIDAMEKDLELVKLETKQLSEEAEELVRAKEQLCCLIVERQKKIWSLETESSTLSQTLELLQQEKLCVAAKFEEKRNYYTKTFEDLDAKQQERQDWFNKQKISITQS
ncbi:ArsR-like helix-turn-helix domain-containing protein, partial [Dioscorea alata]